MADRAWTREWMASGVEWAGDQPWCKNVLRWNPATSTLKSPRVPGVQYCLVFDETTVAG